MLTYKNGTYINHYSIDELGRIVSPQDALPVVLLDQTAIDDLTDQYEGLTALDAECRAYYQARLIYDQGEPELIDGRKTYDVLDDEGNDTDSDEYYPVWSAYNAAKATVENATAIVVSLYNVRMGRPEPVLDDETGETTNQAELDAWDADQAAVLALNTVEYPVIEDLELKLARANQRVSMSAARLVLAGAGHIAGIEAAIAGMTEPDKTQAEIWWNYANSVERMNPLVAQIGGALGITETDMDDLFTAAEAIDEGNT